MNNIAVQPIGVFDSGVGGLSVLKAIRSLLPYEAMLYCADSGYAPYGVRSAEEISARSVHIAKFLIEHQAKALVIACNTATAASAKLLRETWPHLPIIAMEPAVKPATLATRNGIVGVLATAGTLASSQFAALLDTFGRDTQVITQPGIGLVECVERGEINSPATRALLKSHLDVLLDAGADVVVLGCTHYVFLRAEIESIIGSHVHVIDTGAAVAQQLKRRLEENNLCALSNSPTPVEFWSSGELAQAQTVISALWGASVAVQALP